MARPWPIGLARVFYTTAPLWILLAVYWATAINSRLNIGHRHILPVYPATLTPCWGRGPLVPPRWPPAMDYVGGSADMPARPMDKCFAMYPHYLAYFNPLAGGPGNGYKHLVDSSLDWGQDLPGLKRWVEATRSGGPGQNARVPGLLWHSPPSFSANPGHGASSLGATPLRPLTEGVYCIMPPACSKSLSADSLWWRGLREGLPGTAQEYSPSERRRSGPSVANDPIER